MKLISLLCVMFCFGCSLSQPLRTPGSEAINYGVVDFSKSIVIFFKSDEKKGLFISLMNEFNEAVDFKISKISIKNALGFDIKFSSRRTSTGKYYLTMTDQDLQDLELVEVFFENLLFRKVRLPIKQPSAEIKLIQSLPHLAIFHLIISHDSKRPPLAQGSPEIIIEGAEGILYGVHQITPNTWRFELIYPETNQLFYLSAHYESHTYRKIFRFQHVEKQ